MEAKKLLRKETVDDFAGKLVTMKDELRVRLHLAGMESKDTWDELSRYIDRIEGDLKEIKQKVQTSADEVQLKAHLATMDGREVFEEKMDRIKLRLQKSKSGLKTDVRELLDRMDNAYGDFVKRF